MNVRSLVICSASPWQFGMPQRSSERRQAPHEHMIFSRTPCSSSECRAGWPKTSVDIDNASSSAAVVVAPAGTDARGERERRYPAAAR